MTEWIRLAAVSVAVLPSIGCAEIGQRPAVNQDRVVRTETVEVPIAGAHADINQEGSNLHLAVSHLCDVKRFNVVDRTSTTEFYNGSPKQTWLTAGAGLVSAGVGLTLVVDSTSTYPNDPNSRTYNSTGPDKERLYGIGLIGTGALLGTIAFVNAMRANGSGIEHSQIVENAGTVRKATVCSKTPFANAAMTGTVGDQTIVLGKTDGQGKLHVDLDQAASEDLVLGKSATKLTLQANGQPCGTGNLVPLYLRREGKAYDGSDPEACANPTRGDACNHLESFVVNYPDGPHSRAAKEILAGAQTTIGQLRDDATWARSQPTKCAKNDSEDPGAVHRSCDPLRSYLTRYPEGRHADDARKSLAAGDAREKHLVAEIERRENAAQAKEAANERKQCIAICKVGCSGWRIRDAATCFSGCVESRCSGGEQ
jgi:hypothetical protein